MIVACVALFLAATGTGVAVINALPKGSVGTKQLKNNAVISSKVQRPLAQGRGLRQGPAPGGS